MKKFKKKSTKLNTSVFAYANCQNSCPQCTSTCNGSSSLKDRYAEINLEVGRDNVQAVMNG